MTIESAKQFRQLAGQYRAFGFNLVPLGGDKRPVVTGVHTGGGLLRFRWDDWQNTRQTDDLWAQIKKHEWWKEVAGLAAVCGPVSGDLVCIDFDVPKDTVQPFPSGLLAQFLQAAGLNASPWLVDSPRGGFHVWVRCPGLQIDKGKYDRPALGAGAGFHIELRWAGHYAALPGSLHPSGVYAWRGPTPIDGPPCIEVNDLLAAYDAVTVQDVPTIHTPPVRPSTGGGGGWANGAGKWARTAFDAELAELAGVSTNRNDALNKAAFSLGSIVAGGGLDAAEVEQALTGVAENIGLNAGEIAATIRSGMASGAKSPRYPAEREAAPAGYEYGFVVDMPDPASLDEVMAGEGAIDDDGRPRRTLSQRIDEDLEKWGFALSLCELDDTIEVNGERLDDKLDATIRMTARNHQYGGKNGIALSALADQMRVNAMQHGYHPVRRYLAALNWDGRDRFSEFAAHMKDKHTPIVYADGTKEPVIKAFLWRWMVGAVAKVFATGPIRAQNPMLVLSGAQNMGKSTLAAWLCPIPDLFLESGINPDSSDHLRYLVTKWIWEVSELGATTRRSDREALKAFLTRQEATFRKPYDHHPVIKPALSSFIGTVNPMNNGFLDDPTGSRRFLVAELASIDHAYANTIDRDQLWAQVLAAYNANPQAWRLTAEEQAHRDDINQENEVERPYEGLLVRIFDIDPVRSDWWMATHEIVDAVRTYGEAIFDETRHHGVLGSTLRGLGLERKQIRKDGDRIWGYYGIKTKVGAWTP
jgi:hypothetical protein